MHSLAKVISSVLADLPSPIFFVGVDLLPELGWCIIHTKMTKTSTSLIPPQKKMWSSCSSSRFSAEITPSAPFSSKSAWWCGSTRWPLNSGNSPNGFARARPTSPDLVEPKKYVLSRQIGTKTRKIYRYESGEHWMLETSLDAPGSNTPLKGQVIMWLD